MSTRRNVPYCGQPISRKQDREIRAQIEAPETARIAKIEQALKDRFVGLVRTGNGPNWFLEATEQVGDRPQRILLLLNADITGSVSFLTTTEAISNPGAPDKRAFC